MYKKYIKLTCIESGEIIILEEVPFPSKIIVKGDLEWADGDKPLTLKEKVLFAAMIIVIVAISAFIAFTFFNSIIQFTWQKLKSK